MSATFSQINAEIAEQKALKRQRIADEEERRAYRATFRPGQVPIGKGRRAPKDPDAIEIEAMGEPCEDDGCHGVVCYGDCCFPPRDYGELHHAWCHDHLHAYCRDEECRTCDNLAEKLRVHRNTHAGTLI